MRNGVVFSLLFHQTVTNLLASVLILERALNEPLNDKGSRKPRKCCNLSLCIPSPEMFDECVHHPLHKSLI